MGDEPHLESCFSCGGRFAPGEGATHPYMLSTAGCWAAYGELLAREYEDPALFGAAHRLTVDAYALQHAGDHQDRRAVQSVWVHYAALYFALEERRPLAAVPAAMKRLAEGGRFPDLPPAPAIIARTHADVLARPVGEHVQAVREWANGAFRAWDALREPTRQALSALR